MTRQSIKSDKVAPAAGPFSSAVRSGDLVLLSGQVAQDPKTGKLIEGDVRAQTERIFSGLSAVLEAAGKTLSDVVRVGVYLTDMGDFAAMNEVYATFFAPPYPARATVGIRLNDPSLLIELDAIAMRHAS